MENQVSNAVSDIRTPRGGACDNRVSRRLEISIFGEPLELTAEASTQPVRPGSIVPLAHSICDRIVEASIDHAEKQGKRVHCRQGCGDCCKRFMLGLAPTEVFYLLERMPALPVQLRRQAAAALESSARSLTRAGIPSAIARADNDAEARRALSGWWDENRFDCPFLVDDSCGIYPMRFAVCREFISLSDPSTCRTGRCERMPLPFSMIDVLNELSAELGIASPGAVVFPTLLLWADGKMPLAKATLPGVELLDRLFAIIERFAGNAAERQSAAD